MSTKKVWREEEIRKIAREEAEKVFEEKTKKKPKPARSVYEDMTPKEIRERMILGKNHGD